MGREGIGKQLKVNKHAYMSGRQTEKHTLQNIHTLPPTVIHNTRNHHKPTQHIAVTTVGWGGGGGSAPSASELVEFPVILTDRGAGATRFWSLGS